MLKKIFGFFIGKSESEKNCKDERKVLDEDMYDELTEEEFDYVHMYHMH